MARTLSGAPPSAPFLLTEAIVRNSRSVSSAGRQGSKFHEGLLEAALFSSTNAIEENSEFVHEEEDGELEKHYFVAGEVPDMWSKDYIGLYAQYAAIGLIGGSSGTVLPFCSYVYGGQGNVCSNASNIIFFAWTFKIFFALLTDSIRPFGLRRRPWMVFGWGGALFFLAILAFTAHKLSVTSWITMNMMVQFFTMFSDVPADGYSVEMGQLEPPERRGQVLATGQRVRFSCSMLAGLIQTFLLNGPSTSPPDCPINMMNCWSWGLTINQFYGLVFAVCFVCFIPICFLKEPDASRIPRHSLNSFIHEIWDTMSNLTTSYLMVFLIGIGALCNLPNITNVFMQYYLIELTNFQAGIDTISSYGALALAVFLFQTFLINKNWRYTQYGSIFFSSSLGLLWILVYYDVANLRDPWFTIFIDLDQSFAGGISQVLFSMAVIELAKPGQESTTYELLVTVANTAGSLSTMIATQLLTPLHTAGCSDPPCASTTVDITSIEAYNNSDGPHRFTIYTIVILSMGCISCLLFTPFLPSSKEECQEWQRRGELSGQSKQRANLVFLAAVSIVSYGALSAILLLNPKTACMKWIGGAGCPS